MKKIILKINQTYFKKSQNNRKHKINISLCNNHSSVLKFEQNKN